MTTVDGLPAHIAPSTTAVIVVDVQNDFCAKEGYFDRTGADLSLIDPAVNRMINVIEAARGAGAMPIFIRSHYDNVYLSEAQNARRRRMGWQIPLCVQGTWGVEFYRLAPLLTETLVTKHRYDGFYQTDLELILRTNNIRTLVMAGVATNVCVESTLRSGFFRDFEIVLASDCCAARNTQAHDAAVENVRVHFGVVATSEAICKAWESTPSRAVA